MEAKDCIRMLREIKDVAFATVDEYGNPRIRIIDIMYVEDENVYFCTSRGKDFYRQLMASGKTALTGMNEKYQMIRLEGAARRVEDGKQKECIDRIFEENPSMNDVYPGESRYVLEAFSIEKGQVEFFELGQTPIYRETFIIGDAEEEKKGFYITDGCIRCGVCKENCPQTCIREGEPYQISQENCLHCGLCYERCPVQAIERRGQ